MAKEYPLLYGHAGDVCEELHNINEVARFIMKHGVKTDVTIATPYDTPLLSTFGIYINKIADMEYRQELLKVLTPMQMNVFDTDDESENIEEIENNNTKDNEMEM